MSNRKLISTLAIAASILSACVTAKPATLYQRLGGEPRVTAVVNQFMDNVVADWRIRGRFEHADMPKLKRELVTQICAATGGSCTYRGRDMRTAHSGLHITEAEFAALLQDLAKALECERVPAREKRELLAKLSAMNNDVVNR